MKCKCGADDSTFVQEGKGWLYHTCNKCGDLLGERTKEPVGISKSSFQD